MAGSQPPVVCTSLHLPPDIQPFLSIHRVAFEIFLPNLDRLRLTLEETQDVCPEASQIFLETRTILRRELERVFGVLYSCRRVAELYLVLLEAVSERMPTQDPLQNVNGRAFVGIQSSTEGQKAMTRFRSELEGAVGRVSAALSAKYKNDSKASLSSPENTQLVLEIIGGVDECNALLQECHNEYENLRKLTEDEDSIESNPPSADEIQVVRAKWQTLLNNIKNILSHARKIALEIQLPGWANSPNASRKHKAEKSVSLWRTLFQRENKQGAVHSARNPKVLEPCSGIGAVVATLPTSFHALRKDGIDQASVIDAWDGVKPSAQSEAPETALTDSSKLNHPQITFWQRVFKPNGRPNGSADVSGRPKASNGVPHPPFWRKFLPGTPYLGESVMMK